MNTQKKDMAVCILFALIFATGFFLCVFFPKSEYSYSERRSLASRLFRFSFLERALYVGL